MWAQRVAVETGDALSPDLIGLAGGWVIALHREFVAEGTTVRQAVAHDLDRDHLGLGCGVWAATAAASGQQTSSCKGRSQKFEIACQDDVLRYAMNSTTVLFLISQSYRHCCCCTARAITDSPQIF